MQPRTASSALPFFIYLLLDPRHWDEKFGYVPRYCGVTCRPKRRAGDHSCPNDIHRTGSITKRMWVAKLLKLGLKPIFKIVEEIPPDGDWQTRERAWIAELRSAGYNLTNLTDGGDGVPGLRHTEATRAKITERNRGNKNASGKRSEEQRKRMSDAAKRRTYTPEGSAKMSAARKGWKHGWAAGGRKHSAATMEQHAFREAIHHNAFPSFTFLARLAGEEGWWAWGGHKWR